MQGTSRYFSGGYPFKARLFIAPDDRDQLDHLDKSMLEYLLVPFAPNLTVLTDTSGGNSDKYLSLDDTSNCDACRLSHQPFRQFDLKVIQVGTSLVLVTFSVFEEVTWELVGIVDGFDVDAFSEQHGAFADASLVVLSDARHGYAGK